MKKREFLTIVKNGLRGFIIRCPLIRSFYVWMRIHGRLLSDKGIRSRIQQVAHRIDNCISRDDKPPYDAMKAFEYLAAELKRRRLPLDEALLWSLHIYAIGELGLAREYRHGLAGRSVLGVQDCDLGPLERAIRERRSVRKWSEKSVSVTEVKKVIDLAKWAPSSCNRQSWQVLLITTREEKDLLRQYFNGTFWLSAPLLILVLMNVEPYYEFEKHYSYLDSGALIQNTLLLLHARGYGACWIGFAKWDSLGNVHTTSEQVEIFYRHFGIDRRLVPTSMIAVGIPSELPIAPSRQSVDHIIIDRPM